MATLEIDENVIIQPEALDNPTATTFKRLKEHEQPMLMLTGKATVSYNLGTAHSVVPIDLLFNGGSKNWDDYFTFENNSIRIKGNKIRKIIVGGQVLINQAPDATALRLALRWNNNWASQYMCGFQSGKPESLCLPMSIFDVEDGDTFDLAVGGSRTGTYQLVYGDTSTILIIWAIDYDL